MILFLLNMSRHTAWLFGHLWGMWQRVFPFSQTKRATDPRFSLREEEKLRENREQERCQKDLESYRKALGLARGSF